MFDVITIGKATRDAFFEGDFPFVRWPKAESGKAYAFPFGEKLEVKKVYFTIGGNAANASVTFAKQGFETACVTKTGADVSGEEIKRRLKKEGVGTRFITSDRNLPTAYSVLLLEKGERTILNYAGASGSLSAGDFDMKKIKAKWWYVSLPGDFGLFPRIVNFASKNGIALAFNPSGHHLKQRKNEILSLLDKLSFVVMNEEEASLLTGVSFRKKNAVFEKLSRRASGIVAITDGKKGATVSCGNFVYKAGVFKEKNLIDRTGAGDAFGSGFVSGLLSRGITAKNVASAKPFDIEYALRLATANATSVVEKIGATEGILKRSEFERNKRWRNFKIAIHKA